MAPKVAVLRTSPESVIEDYAHLMHLAEYQKLLPKDNKTVLNLNLSWTLFYPACILFRYNKEYFLSGMARADVSLH